MSGRYLKNRKHKGMIFEPTSYVGPKRQLTSLLVQSHPDIRTRSGEPLGKGRIADKYYFRLYKHKGQDYALYLGPEKYTHGGLRHRTRDTRHRKKIKYHRIDYDRDDSISEREETENELSKILRNYVRIESGPHEGMYKHKDSGKIISEIQLRIMLAQRKVE
jgi:hypothetical protein